MQGESAARKRFARARLSEGKGEEEQHSIACEGAGFQVVVKWI